MNPKITDISKKVTGPESGICVAQKEYGEYKDPLTMWDGCTDHKGIAGPPPFGAVGSSTK
jgi:hypothetical protein